MVSPTRQTPSQAPFRHTGRVSEPLVSPLESPLVCSAKGCRATAVWAIAWNNPKLHTPERRKIWLACDEHLPTLRDFLSVRSFLRSVDPVPETR